MDRGNRLKIGIIFNFKGTWLGGVYYILNTIGSLNFLDEESKPEIVIFYNESLANFVREIKYPYLKLVPVNFGGLFKNYLKSWLSFSNTFAEDKIRQYGLDGMYPLNDQPVPLSRAAAKRTVAAAWFPDLQHKFYPDFFTRRQLLQREMRLRLLLRNTTDLVVSSHDVANHFRKFYRIRPDLKIHVLHFASLMDDRECSNIDAIRSKYGLPRDYFMVSNQFHNHKNHTVVFKALSILKAQGSRVHIAVTGKMENYGNSQYIDDLRTLIRENALESNLSMLGVIPREDQLCLMKHARAIVQPSLFEGWSTVIEDAKSLQVPVIASALPVHKEQLEEKGSYFDPHDEHALARMLASFTGSQGRNLYDAYENRVRSFARDFVKIFDQKK